MFQLTVKEARELLRSQNVTLKRGQHLKYLPYVFTENGVAMLSSVLSSEQAILVNIQIMRTFARIREILATHGELKLKIEGMEKKYDGQFRVVFEAIRQLMAPPVKPKEENRLFGQRTSDKVWQEMIYFLSLRDAVDSNGREGDEETGPCTDQFVR